MSYQRSYCSTGKVTSSESSLCPGVEWASESIHSTFGDEPFVFTVGPDSIRDFFHLQPPLSTLSFAFAAATVCHCILKGESAPPHANGLT